MRDQFMMEEEIEEEPLQGEEKPNNDRETLSARISSSGQSSLTRRQPRRRPDRTEGQSFQSNGQPPSPGRRRDSSNVNAQSLTSNERDSTNIRERTDSARRQRFGSSRNRFGPSPPIDRTTLTERQQRQSSRSQSVINSQSSLPRRNQHGRIRLRDQLRSTGRQGLGRTNTRSQLAQRRQRTSGHSQSSTRHLPGSSRVGRRRSNNRRLTGRQGRPRVSGNNRFGRRRSSDRSQRTQSRNARRFWTRSNK